MKRKLQTTKIFGKLSSLFSQIKPPSDKKVALIEKDKIIKTPTKTANVLNTFFSTIISNLNIPEHPVSDSVSNDINDPVVLFILNHKYQPSIKAIEKISKLNNLFKFSNVEKAEILYEIVNLDALKSFQDTDVPTKFIKENADILIRLPTKMSFHIF